MLQFDTYSDTAFATDSSDECRQVRVDNPLVTHRNWKPHSSRLYRDTILPISNNKCSYWYTNRGLNEALSTELLLTNIHIQPLAIVREKSALFKVLSSLKARVAELSEHAEETASQKVKVSSKMTMLSFVRVNKFRKEPALFLEENGYLTAKWKKKKSRDDDEALVLYVTFFEQDRIQYRVIRPDSNEVHNGLMKIQRFREQFKNSAVIEFAG